MNIASLTFAGFIKEIISGIIQPVTVLIFALSILYFLWNVAQFIRNIDNKDEIEKFKKNAMWGIVAIFVMASMWGLVQILINSFVPGAGIPNFDSSGNVTNPRQYSEPIGPVFESGAPSPKSSDFFNLQSKPINSNYHLIISPTQKINYSIDMPKVTP